jgi:hypothetical protein
LLLLFGKNCTKKRSNCSGTVQAAIIIATALVLFCIRIGVYANENCEWYNTLLVPRGGAVG